MLVARAALRTNSEHPLRLFNRKCLIDGAQRNCLLERRNVARIAKGTDRGSHPEGVALPGLAM